MIYELRIYDILPGRMAAINNRFAHTTSRFFEKHGIRVVGYWEDLVGTSNRLTYLVAYESLAHREQVWNAFASDPEWLAVNTVIEESQAWQVIPRLKEANAQGIVEYPLNKVVM